MAPPTYSSSSVSFMLPSCTENRNSSSSPFCPSAYFNSKSPYVLPSSFPPLHSCPPSPSLSPSPKGFRTPAFRPSILSPLHPPVAAAHTPSLPPTDNKRNRCSYPPRLFLPASAENQPRHAAVGSRLVHTRTTHVQQKVEVVKLVERSRGLSIDSIPKKIIECQYAVRGEIVHRALEIEKELRNSEGCYNFTATLPANIGNPQAVGQTPITFHRQMLSCMLSPELLSTTLFPSDVMTRARSFLSSSISVGAYSHSKGIAAYREYVAEWLVRRDQIPVDPESVFLTDGASPGVRLSLELFIEGPLDGVLIPIPQYPLYSATIARLGGTAVNYYLQERSNWSVDLDSLKQSFEEAVSNGITPKALVVINPGNPTGAVMTKLALQQLCQFCSRNRLVLLADEVYQENVYGETPFVSCRKVAHEMGLSSLQIMSFHSCSKGLLGECGLRGGMLQVDNVDVDVLSQMYKLSSIALCSNTVGQALMASSVNPPVPGEPSYERYAAETDAIYSSLKRKAEFMCWQLNQLEGMSCQRVEGAMYAFPRVELPLKSIEEAKRLGVQPDLMYCKQMLEHTGVVTVPGSGFGQEEGTWHFRITILPQEDKLTDVMESVSKFHSKFMEKYKD
eukprot:GHVS01019198.1.p1 GENE.GHVS01019198.1~~GHVS01019198.1.p1  ORF type:complete len:714 (-),score=124.66 GHVS01019198.1:617-2473(-)